jgi:uncharacterized protein (DUF433 family)
MMDGMLPAALGIYSTADAERITGAPRHQIHGWLRGYPQRKGQSRAAPILHRQHELLEDELALGFLDLLEVAFLHRLKGAAERSGKRLKWKALRIAADTARRITNSEHPFAAKRIHTDGRSIFLEAQEATGDPALYDLVRDNFAILDVLVQSFIATIDYEDDEPRRWTPDERFPRIRIDPLRAFGRPIETTSGVPAETLFDAWKAEGQKTETIAAWYGTDREGVDQAVHYTLGIGRGHAAAA